jgi:hypothetical protein
LAYRFLGTNSKRLPHPVADAQRMVDGDPHAVANFLVKPVLKIERRVLDEVARGADDKPNSFGFNGEATKTFR